MRALRSNGNSLSCWWTLSTEPERQCLLKAESSIRQVDARGSFLKGVPICPSRSPILRLLLFFLRKYPGEMNESAVDVDMLSGGMRRLVR
jgi:hypothetical protein